MCADFRDKHPVPRIIIDENDSMGSFLLLTTYTGEHKHFHTCVTLSERLCSDDAGPHYVLRRGLLVSHLRPLRTHTHIGHGAGQQLLLCFCQGLG